MGRKKRTLQKTSSLWVQNILFLHKKGLLEEFKKEIEDSYEYGFFIGMCKGVQDILKNYNREIL